LCGGPAAGAAAAAAMLLLDSTTLSIHEVDAQVVSAPASPPCISFEHFEATARSAFCSAFLATRSSDNRIGTEALAFVRLSDGRGWAWASRIRVAHRDQLPIADLTIGEEFLFLWPVPMAINAYLSFREKLRQSGGVPEHWAPLARAIEAHPPSMGFVSHQSTGDAVDGTRALRAKDLTVAQRLFVASLAPHATAFSVRSPTDRWAETLSDEDRRHLHHFLLTAGAGGGDADADAAAPCPAARAHARQTGARAAFDASDDVVGRIACVCLSQSMVDLAEMRLAVARLRLVSQQFRRATDAALQQLVRTVTATARSLLGDRPREPRDVQAVVQAAGLTLRHALALKVGGGWHTYALARLLVDRCSGGVVPKPVRALSPRVRHRLLWDVGVA
jgi:hypothetical protein